MNKQNRDNFLLAAYAAIKETVNPTKVYPPSERKKSSLTKKERTALKKKKDKRNAKKKSRKRNRK